MRKAFIFRSLCMVMAWVYCTVTAQAGQVITQKERAWAKRSVSVPESERNLAPVSTSNSLAVLYFNNKTGLEDLNSLQKGMAVMLINDLSKVERLQVVERIKVQALLDEMNLGASGIVDTSTAPKLGKLLGAYYITTGDIAIGKMAELNISPVLVDVPFETVTPLTVASGNLQDMFRMEKEILSSIIKQMKVFLSPKEREELKKPFAANSAAALAFFAGLDFSDRGKYAEAIKMYEKAVQEDKNFSTAKDALQELKTLGLTSSEETTTPLSPASKEAVEGGTSSGTIALATLGVLAVGGGIALALSSSGGGGSSPTTTTPPAGTGPVILSTDPVAGSTLASCQSGAISFTFDKTIQNCANVRFTAGWSLVDQTTRDKVLKVDYQADTITTGSTSTSVCDSASVTTLTATVSGCSDVSGNSMKETSFQFNKGK